MRRTLFIAMIMLFFGSGISQNVGIGTLTPQEKLHVKDGNLKLDDDFSLIYNAQAGDTTGIRFRTADIQYGSMLYYGTPKMLNISGNDTIHGLLYNFGTNKTFIGRNYQISAQEKFGITRKITSADFGGMYFETKGHVGGKPFYGYAIDGTGKAYHYFDGTSDTWRLNAAGDRLTVMRASGFLGVGVTAPLDRLHVLGSARLQDPNPTLKLYQDTTLSASLKHSAFSTTLASHVTGGSLVFRTSDQDHMWVRSDGKVLIGRSSSISGSEKFGIRASVVGPAFGGMYLEANGDPGGKPFYGYALNGTAKVWHYYDGADNKWKIDFGGTRLAITQAGAVGINQVNPMDQLHVTGGDIRIDATVQPQLKFFTNGVYAVNIEHFNDDLSIANMMNGNLLLKTNNTDRLMVESAGDVGIGVSNALERLHVGGRIRIDDVSPGLFLYDGGTFRGQFINSGSTTILSCLSGDILSLRNGTTEGIRIYSGGSVVLGLSDLYIDNVNHRVGIGTLAPAAKLHVKDGDIRIDNTNPGLFLYSSGAYASSIQQTGTTMRIRNTLNGNLHLGTNNTDDVTINASGNMGVGGTPSDRVHVFGNVRIENSQPQLRLFVGNSEVGNLKTVGTNMSLNNLQTNGYLAFGTENTNRMYIKSDGNVGIGEVSPIARLHVNGDAILNNTTKSRLMLFNSGSTVGELNAEAGIVSLDNTSGSGVGTRLRAGTAEVMLFRDGNIEVDGNTLVVTPSTNRVGIGTNAPVYGVDIDATNERGVDVLNSYGGSSVKYGIRTEVNANGTGTRYGLAGLATANASDNSPSYGVYGFANGNAGPSTLYGVFAGVSTSGTGTKYGLYASAANQTNAWAIWSNGDAHFSDDVRIGHTSDVPGYLLSVDGKIIGEEIKVQLSQNWPDYVFEKEYELRSATDLESFIQEYGHLPGVPSARQVEEEDGIHLGEMNRILLEKVEELTLLIIEQDKRIRQLERQQ